MGKHALGEFEFLVLLAALRLGENAYGLSIAREIEERAGRPAARASVYVTLRRLEKKGLISTRRESSQEASRGRPRRLVSLEPEAIELVREGRQTFRRMWAGLDELLEEA